MIIAIKDLGDTVDTLSEIFDAYNICGLISVIMNFITAVSLTTIYFVQQNAWEEENREKYERLMAMEDVNRTSSYLGAAAPGGFYCRQDML